MNKRSVRKGLKHLDYNPGQGFTTKEKDIPSLVKDPSLIELRRMQIIEAAVDLFVRKGFHETTTREIARKSGLSIGTIYEYIGSKEDVLYLVCDYIHSCVERGIKASITEAKTGKEMLINAIQNYFKVCDDMQDYILLIYQETKSLPTDALRHVLAKEERITAYFEEVLRIGQTDKSLVINAGSITLMAHNIVVLGHMWTFRRWFFCKHYSLEQYIQIQTSLILSELTKRDVQAQKENNYG
ncbi:MAG: TetR/AcrR family transcriptional regulator [Deltaproteobacteria bacterium]|nr:TetR/AcrR family transcriptional regulator [Deltaproteobacteria bacterium]